MLNDPYANAPRLPAEGDFIDPREIIGGAPQPLELEIGPGRGGFLFERLAAAPVRLMGLEIRRKWATIVDNKLRERGYGQRARVFAEDARAAVARFPDSCVQTVFIHFPDPWWKRKHHKRLVVADELTRCLQRVLVPGGDIFVQTDVEERAHAYYAILCEAPALEPVGNSPWVEENPYEARSPRERRAMADGLPIFRLRYRKKIA